MSGDDLDVEFEKCEGLPYEQLAKLAERDKMRAVEAANLQEEAEKLKRCADIQQTFTQWDRGYFAYLPANTPWGKHPGNLKCSTMKHENIFTNSCTDYPDWRVDENRRRDEARVAVEYPKLLNRQKARAEAKARGQAKREAQSQ